MAVISGFFNASESSGRRDRVYSADDFGAIFEALLQMVSLRSILIQYMTQNQSYGLLSRSFRQTMQLPDI